MPRTLFPEKPSLHLADFPIGNIPVAVQICLREESENSIFGKSKTHHLHLGMCQPFSQQPPITAAKNSKFSINLKLTLC